MRSPLWFVVAGVIALAGFAGAALYLWPRLGSIDAGTIRVVVPGSTVVSLEKPGGYTIYHEQQSYVDGEFYASGSIAGLRVTLASEATGVPVRLDEPSTSSSYSIGSRRGTSIFAFHLDQPGRYRLTTTLAGGPAAPKAVLAIAQGMLARMFGLIAATMAIAGAGLALAAIIVGLTIWQRSRAAANARAAGPAPGPSP